MDQSKSNALGNDSEKEAMERGTAFLAAASQTSNLAARYVSMLQSTRNETKQKENKHNGMHRNAVETAFSQRNDKSDAAQAIMRPLSQPSPQLPGDLELPDENSMDFDDWLLGVGLPQQLLPLNHFNSGYLL
jgi:hypothetical protein